MVGWLIANKILNLWKQKKMANEVERERDLFWLAGLNECGEWTVGKQKIVAAP